MQSCGDHPHFFHSELDAVFVHWGGSYTYWAFAGSKGGYLRKLATRVLEIFLRFRMSEDHVKRLYVLRFVFYGDFSDDGETWNVGVTHLLLCLRAAYFLDYFPDIKADGAFSDASSAPHAEVFTEIVDIIVELVHYPLPHHLSAGRAWVMT